MRNNIRTLTAIGTAAAALAAGIFGARVLQPQDEVVANPSQFGPPVLVDGNLDVGREQTIPLLTPVATGDDPAILEQLLEGPPLVDEETVGPETGRPGGGPAVVGDVSGPTIATPDIDTATPIDGSVPPPETTASGPSPDAHDFPLVFDPIGGLSPLPELAFDICAGREPGTPSFPTCPEGYGGTLHADRIAPATFMYGSTDHYLSVSRAGDFPTTCPAGTPPAAPGETAITVFSQTPLDSLFVEWRPYGSSLAWRSMTVDPATLADQRADWFARFERDPFSREAFYLPRCLAVERDPNTAYEVRLSGVDAFLRIVNGNSLLILPDETPGGRPPTQARVIGVQPSAEVQAWTKPAGSVSFATRVITDAADNACDYRLQAIDPSAVHTGSGLASPVGIYDPAFTRLVATSIALPPGGMVLLCATIYDTANTLRPLGTDTLVLQGRSQQRPRITLDGFRIAGGITIPYDSFLDISVRSAGSGEAGSDGCGRSWRASNDLYDRVSVGELLWTCDTAPLPVDSSGRVDVSLTISRSGAGEFGHRPRRATTFAVPIQVDRCDPECPSRPDEWYEIPVPWSTAPSVDLGEGLRDVRPCLEARPYAGCPALEGYAIIHVEYPVTDGPTGIYAGTARTVASSDRPVADPIGGQPTIFQTATTFGPTEDWSALPARVSLISDRPVTINSVHLTDGLGDAGLGCNDRTVTVGGLPATEFILELPVCAGTLMAVDANVTDAAGVVWTLRVGRIFAPRILAPSVHTTVEFLGGEVPRFGWIYQFVVSLDHQMPTYYGWFNWSATTASDGSSCMALDDAVADGPHGPPITVSGGSLEVFVRVNISAGGEADCGRGTGGTYSGTTEFSGSFTATELGSGEPLVLTTPADSALQLRITITPNGVWRLVV